MIQTYNKMQNYLDNIQTTNDFLWTLVLYYGRLYYWALTGNQTTHKIADSPISNDLRQPRSFKVICHISQNISRKLRNSCNRLQLSTKVNHTCPVKVISMSTNVCLMQVVTSHTNLFRTFRLSLLITVRTLSGTTSHRHVPLDSLTLFGTNFDGLKPSGSQPAMANKYCCYWSLWIHL